MGLSNVRGNKNLSNGGKCALALFRKVFAGLALEVKASCASKVVEERLQNASKAYDAAKRAEAAKVCNPDVPRSATGTWDLKAKLDRKSKTQVTFPSLFKT